MNLKQQHIDPELMYCLQCQDEYRAGFTVCAVCAGKLVSGRELLQSGQQGLARQPVRIGPEDSVVAIRKGSMVEIKQMQALLARSGVDSRAAADPAACGKNCCGKAAEVLLQVREADLEIVREILTREYIRSTGLNDHSLHHVNSVYNSEAREAICPACGCRFPTSQAECPDCGLCFA